MRGDNQIHMSWSESGLSDIDAKARYKCSLDYQSSRIAHKSLTFDAVTITP